MVLLSNYSLYHGFLVGLPSSTIHIILQVLGGFDSIAIVVEYFTELNF